MSFSWSHAAGASDLGEMLAKRQYARAAKALRSELELIDRPALRQQLADVLVLDGRNAEALVVLEGLAEQWEREGQAAKAIAVLKKIQRLDPERKALGAATPGARTGVPGSLGKAVLFSDFTREELAAVVARLALRAFEPGDVVVTEGEPGGSLFVVATGGVKAFVRDRDGRSRRVRSMGEGSFFGEVSILRGGARTATVTAAAPTELLELTRDDLDGIVAAHPRVREVMESFCALRLGSAAERESRGELEFPEL